MTPRQILASIPARDFAFGFFACACAYLFAAGVCLIAN